MELGRHLRELSGHPVAAAICLLLAIAAALTVTYKVSILPPKLESRSLEIASARAEVLVDTPRSSVLDLRQGSSEMERMTNRAVLIGNVMVSPPVLAYIGRRAGIPPGVIQARAPLTPDFPRPLSRTGDEPRTSDLLRSTEQYRLNVQTNPTVPIVQIFAQAPTAAKAAALANAAVDGLQDYVADTARRQGTAPEDLVRLEPLGRAEGMVINDGIRTQLAILSFFVVFGLSSGFAVVGARVRKGWKLDGEPPAGPAAPARSRRPATESPPSDDEDDLRMAWDGLQPRDRDRRGTAGTPAS